VERIQKGIIPHADVEAYATNDWMNDPYAKGAWACFGLDSACEYLEELQNPHGCIVFASADWADGWRGFLDGAIERGQVAVRDIMDLMEGSRGTPTARL
jgi:lysyl oxidase-like protein 2/3/4